MTRNRRPPRYRGSFEYVEKVVARSLVIDVKLGACSGKERLNTQHNRRPQMDEMKNLYKVLVEISDRKT
jgi:hypothetical protein